MSGVNIRLLLVLLVLAPALLPRLSAVEEKRPFDPSLQQRATLDAFSSGLVVRQQASLSIRTPKAGQRLSTPSITANGMTRGFPIPARILVRLENANGAGPFQIADGIFEWSIPLSGVVPGQNSMTVRSLDAGGTVIREATVSFRYVVLGALNIIVTGEGSVTNGFAGTTERELGRRYMITARPDPGALFDHWSMNGIGSSKPTVDFIMREGTTLVAYFKPNPFYLHRGVYHGLVHATPLTTATSGLVRINNSPTGAFSGRLLFGGTSHSFTGHFDEDGNAERLIARGPAQLPLIVQLRVDLAAATGEITGSVREGETQGVFIALKGPGAGTQHFAEGRHTLILREPAGSGSAKGHACMKVRAGGTASLTGHLSDGRAFSQGVVLSKTGLFPLYSTLGKSGALAGTLSISQGDGSMEGNVLWSRKPCPRDTCSPEGFEVILSTTGGRYTAPQAGSPALAVPSGENNLLVQFADGNLAAAVVQNATLRPDNKIHIATPLLSKLSLAMTTATGRFSGSFIHPASQRLCRFKGVLLQSQNSGSGHFSGQNKSGSVEFSVVK